jgi:hypothetical protein
MYRAIGLLRPDTDFTLDEAQARLAAKLPGLGISRDRDQIVASQGDWWIAMRLAAGPDVQMEVEGLVSHVAGIEPSEAEEYVSTARRVEVWTDIPDPFMEHFNDYLSVVEVLKSFNGLLAVDPNERGVL